MTPLLRTLKTWWEKAWGTFYEGPEPPARLLEHVLLFTVANPKATRREWVEFAARLAGEAYQTGYVRGFEHTVREEGAMRELVDDSELVADTVDPGWRERLADPDAVVE